MSESFQKNLKCFVADTSGASMVEYSVALIVVTIVGIAVFGMGGDIAGIIDLAAGAF